MVMQRGLWHPNLQEARLGFTPDLRCSALAAGLRTAFWGVAHESIDRMMVTFLYLLFAKISLIKFRALFCSLISSPRLSIQRNYLMDFIMACEYAGCIRA